MEKLLLQRNSVCGFAFLGADEVGVDLGGFDALVGEHLGDRVDVCAECDLKRCESVSKAVERDMLPNPRSLYPGIQWVLNHTSAQPCEHYTLALHLAAQF